MSYYVKIHYGPSEAFYTVSHKPQKLAGLRDKLLKLGYRVDLIPVQFRDYCMLEMCGYEVFRCSVGNLLFNTPYELDPVCRRAVQAVEDATMRIMRARLYFWLWYWLEEQIFMRSEYAPRQYWTHPDDFPELSLATVQQCVDCCGILTAKKNHTEE